MYLLWVSRIPWRAIATQRGRVLIESIVVGAPAMGASSLPKLSDTQVAISHLVSTIIWVALPAALPPKADWPGTRKKGRGKLCGPVIDGELTDMLE